MSELVLTRGLPASGKTTWARAWVDEDPEMRARSNRDDLRASLFGRQGVLSRGAEDAITEVQRRTVAALLARGLSVVVDDMHLRPRYVREWVRFARAHGVEAHTVEMPVDVPVAVARDAARERTVGADVIRKLASLFLQRGAYLPVEPVEDEQPVAAPYAGTPGAPTSVLVDIDGTVALMRGRSPYDLSLVHTDEPNPAVVDVVRGAKAAGHAVVFCSGRESTARHATDMWLREHVGLDDFVLLMRAEGDRRRDSVVKAELFNRHVRHAYDVQYVLDDRQQVVDMWRSLGLTVLQVAPGDF